MFGVGLGVVELLDWCMSARSAAWQRVLQGSHWAEGPEMAMGFFAPFSVFN
jgi:hypothetical protein